MKMSIWALKISRFVFWRFEREGKEISEKI